MPLKHVTQQNVINPTVVVAKSSTSTASCFFLVGVLPGVCGGCVVAGAEAVVFGSFPAGVEFEVGAGVVEVGSVSFHKKSVASNVPNVSKNKFDVPFNGITLYTEPSTTRI